MGKKKKHNKFDSGADSDIDMLEGLAKLCAFVVFVWLWISCGSFLGALFIMVFVGIFFGGAAALGIAVCGIWLVCKLVGAIFGAIDKRISAPKKPKQPAPVQKPITAYSCGMSADDSPYPPIFPASKQPGIFDDLDAFIDIDHRDDWAFAIGCAGCVIFVASWISAGSFWFALVCTFLVEIACYIIGALVLRSVNNKRRARQDKQVNDWRNMLLRGK